MPFKRAVLTVSCSTTELLGNAFGAVIQSYHRARHSRNGEAMIESCESDAVSGGRTRGDLRSSVTRRIGSREPGRRFGRDSSPVTCRSISWPWCGCGGTTKTMISGSPAEPVPESARSFSVHAPGRVAGPAGVTATCGSNNSDPRYKQPEGAWFPEPSSRMPLENL